MCKLLHRINHSHNNTTCRLLYSPYTTRASRRRPSHDDPLSPPATYPLRSASIGSGVGREKHESPGRNSLVDRVKTLDPVSGATRLEPVRSGVGRSGGHHRGRRLVAPGGGAEPEGFGVGELRCICITRPSLELSASRVCDLLARYLLLPWLFPRTRHFPQFQTVPCFRLYPVSDCTLFQTARCFRLYPD